LASIAVALDGAYSNAHILQCKRNPQLQFTFILFRSSVACMSIKSDGNTHALLACTGESSLPPVAVVCVAAGVAVK
jgi:hypothetical protein